jgi:hypothetical protein
MGILGYVNEKKEETGRELDNALMRERNERMKEYAKKEPENWEFIEKVIETMEIKDHPLAVYMAFAVILMDWIGYDALGDGPKIGK